jgi:peptidoglycan/xylan/chitin deacetylase (PgdA/CDA1 family)
LPSYAEMLDTASRWRERPALERVPAAGAALTFDDGPDPEGTPAVLDALDAAGVKATFFVVGEQLMRHHAIARETLARGHELALHGFEHVRHDALPGGTARDDVARSIGTFEAAVGRRARFFRPPYGLFTEHSYEACADLGLDPVYWSAWGLDWETIAAERIAELVAGDLSEGAVILLHDSARYGHRPSAAPTAEAVGLIAARAGELGLTLAPLGELVPPGSPTSGRS